MQSVFESQVKRQYKYALHSDVELCEREALRMLKILRHLFFNSHTLLTELVTEQHPLQTSKMSQTNKGTTKKGDSFGEKIVALWTQVLEELGERHPEVLHETLRGAITFASQNGRFKALFAGSAKRTSLLKLCLDKLLT